MVDFIFIAGSPGTGKTTISNLLKEKLSKAPVVDYGWIRQYHLDKTWSNASKASDKYDRRSPFRRSSDLAREAGIQLVITNELDLKATFATNELDPKAEKPSDLVGKELEVEVLMVVYNTDAQSANNKLV